MSKQTFRLKVPAEPSAEFVGHGNHDFHLVAGELVTTQDPRVRDWLIEVYKLELIDTVEEETGEVTEPADEDPNPPDRVSGPRLTVDPDTYPADFPGREKLIDANVPFDTVKTLTHEQLVEYPGIGPKTAADIVAYFGGDE